MSDVHAQALDNLVNQFARPLDFLRELAQNSIDAGSPRIEVWVDYLPPTSDARGVLQIGVDDFGEGMSEQIIDDKLSRLFESTKDDDLTKIGKFGIGFTSIFAIGPDAVVLLTGRHGTSWKLHFHADRTFSKLAYDEPVHGTKITLYKEYDPDDVEAFVRDAEANLSYWCEHSDTPITFDDRTRHQAAPVADTADPFAAFADEAVVAGPEPINRPLDLPSDLLVRHDEPGTQVVIGYASPPRYGFYNGGLTLLNTPHHDALGDFADVVGHLSFKVKSDRLEHTLTRDNVLHDDHWRQAMNVVVRAQAKLRDATLARAEEAARSGDDEVMGRWHGRLAAECAAANGKVLAERLAEVPLFRDVQGHCHTLRAVRSQEGKVGAVLTAPHATPLTEALHAQGLVVLVDQGPTRQLLTATEEPSLFASRARERRVARAEELFVLPDVVDDAHLDRDERRLLEHTRELLSASLGLHLHNPLGEGTLSLAPAPDSVFNRLEVVVGDFGGTTVGAGEVLALNGPRDQTVFARPGPAWWSLPSFLSWRTLLVNRHHPLFRAQVLASHEHLGLASAGLAQALLHAEGLEGERTYDELMRLAFEGL
jgi:hypothetical protein